MKPMQINIDENFSKIPLGIETIKSLLIKRLTFTTFPIQQFIKNEICSQANCLGERSIEFEFRLVSRLIESTKLCCLLIFTSAESISFASNFKSFTRMWILELKSN